MKRVSILAVVALLALATAPAFAGTQDFAVIGLHAEAHLQKGGDPCAWDGSACSSFVTEWPAFSSADIYLIIARGEADPGVAALSCGILYNNGDLGASTMNDATGIDCYGWTLCTSGLQFPNGYSGAPADEWPASGGGNRITWDASVDCQTATIGGDGVHALAGSFYVYAYGPDLFQVTPNNNLLSGAEYQVGDCNNAITDLTTPFAAVGFGGLTGANPCDPVPVQPATWGQIKSKY